MAFLSILNVRRAVSAILAVSAFTIIWGIFYHLVLLQGADQEIQHLYRPDMADKMWLSILGVFGISCFFVAGYRLAARRGTVIEGMLYGVCFSVLAALLVDLNQYVLYPIPGMLAIKWYLGGFVEFGVDGLLVSLIYPCKPLLMPGHKSG